MQTTRIEVNENGEYLLPIPADIVEQYILEEGDPVEWDDNDEDFIILTRI